MNCLQVNKFWYRRAGADIYAMDLATALEERGHRIRVLATAHPSNVTHTDAGYWPRYRELSGGGRALGVRDRAAAVVDLVFNRDAARAVHSMLDSAPVDVAHVHNFTKHLSAAPLLALRERGVPVVTTLHDHWPTCPTYSLVHGDGTRCEWECARNGITSAVRHRCVAGSRLASSMAVLEAGVQRAFGWGLELFDLIIAPSRFLAESLGAIAHPKHRVRVVPHPRPRYIWTEPPRYDVSVFFAGRLAREKGVQHLIDAARGARWRLTIAGRGPYESELRDQATGMPNVRFAGVLPTAEVIRQMQDSQVVVVPSTWYENAPLVVLEALAVGRTVVASRIGGMPEYLDGAPWARLVPPGDAPSIRTAVDELTADPRHVIELGRAAWEASAAAPGWPEHVNALEGEYRQLVA